jgi:HAD superfamily 5'-nucleotidase-like hydrolase
VFVNRGLKLGAIDWIGFDMDYTLAIYRQEEMDRLSIEATVKKLVARGYPEALLDLPYPVAFPVRGLIIDKKLGHVLKLDRFKHPQKGYHGLRKLDRDELRRTYLARRIRATGVRFHWVDTLYALSEVAVYVGAIDFFEHAGLAVDFATLFHDIRECIDEAHRDGSIVDTVENDLPRFVERDPLLAPTLHKLRSAGKRLFLLTNSRARFTNAMMTYLLGDAMPEYPSYRHYFDLLVVAAGKPGFFEDTRPLLSRIGDELRPASGPVERGTIYEGGNVAELERVLGTTGDRVLYVGDHIYGDILRSKRESAWRTAMIIQEMEAEVHAFEKCRSELDRVHELSSEREELEDELRFWQQRFKDLGKRASEESDPTERANLEAERTRAKRTVERIRGLMRGIDAHTEGLERAIDACFHPYWGAIMKEADDRSCFGDQVEEYACLYTSRVSNLSFYSPMQHFRSGRERMAHEL